MRQKLVNEILSLSLLISPVLLCTMGRALVALCL